MAKQTTKKVIADLQRENAKLRAKIEFLYEIMDKMNVDLGGHYETNLR